ncbi:hypothetical protein V8C40DRAFT_161669 [Trichoderma camerunense]
MHLSPTPATKQPNQPRSSTHHVSKAHDANLLGPSPPSTVPTPVSPKEKAKTEKKGNLKKQRGDTPFFLPRCQKQAHPCNTLFSQPCSLLLLLCLFFFGIIRLKPLLVLVPFTLSQYGKITTQAWGPRMSSETQVAKAPNRVLCPLVPFPPNGQGWAAQ